MRRVALVVSALAALGARAEARLLTRISLGVDAMYPFSTIVMGSDLKVFGPAISLGAAVPLSSQLALGGEFDWSHHPGFSQFDCSDCRAVSSDELFRSGPVLRWAA